MDQYSQQSVPNLAKTGKNFLLSKQKKKEDNEKLIHINMAYQKKFSNLMKTSKSRFIGV